MKSTVAILDIGTSKITCMVADSVSAGEFVVRATGVCGYNGYDSKGFFEPESVHATVHKAVSLAVASYGRPIRSIVVGVPVAFSYMGNSEASTVFRTKKKIDLYDINDIIVKADIYGDIEGKLVSSNALYYNVDEDTRMIFNPVGIVASRVMGVVSFCYMTKQFEKIIIASLTKCGVRKIKFVNGAEAQAKYIANKYNRHYHAIAIDIGHINTAVMLASGKGVLLAKSFDLGSGYVAGDLCQVLRVSYANATALLSQIDLSRAFGEDDNYHVDNVNVSASKANNIARARIEQIARYIMKCFAMYDKQVPINTPIVLTGGGLTYMRGGVQYLSQCLGKEVIVYANDNPQIDHNEYNSAYALVSCQFANNADSKTNNILGRWRGN